MHVSTCSFVYATSSDFRRRRLTEKSSTAGDAASAVAHWRLYVILVNVIISVLSFSPFVREISLMTASCKPLDKLLPKNYMAVVVHHLVLTTDCLLSCTGTYTK
jgi:cytochrome b561